MNKYKRLLDETETPRGCYHALANMAAATEPLSRTTTEVGQIA